MVHMKKAKVRGRKASDYMNGKKLSIAEEATKLPKGISSEKKKNWTDVTNARRRCRRGVANQDTNRPSPHN